MNLCEKSKCFGCGACAAVCPKKCIRMELDEEGFDYPLIDQTSCINCGACQKVCPVEHSPVYREPIRTYAAWQRDEAAHKVSTSGGISDALAKTILKAGGVVFGAAMREDFSVCHKMVERVEDAPELQGSKYIQSRTLDTYLQVKEALSQGKKVLYTGTPCQIAGLKNYIGEHENLYCADIICHGTPAYASLKKHIEEIEKKTGQKAAKLSFRSSAYLLLLLLLPDGRKLYERPATKDPWYLGFLRGLFYKESCYTCPFAQRERVSDITMGDFWGLQEKELEKKARFGVSVMMVNTEKGQELCEMASDLLEMCERTTDEAVAGNKQLRHPMPMHRNYKRFKKMNRKRSFKFAAMCSLFPERVGYAILNKLK